MRSPELAFDIRRGEPRRWLPDCACGNKRRARYVFVLDGFRRLNDRDLRGGVLLQRQRNSLIQRQPQYFGGALAGSPLRPVRALRSQRNPRCQRIAQKQNIKNDGRALANAWLVFICLRRFVPVAISRTMAWFKQPSATSLPPC